MHADLNGATKENAEYNPILESTLMLSDFDYIALGHIHKNNVYENKKIVYPGSLISGGFDELGKHGMVVGEINEIDRKITREFISLDNKEFKEIEINIDVEKDMKRTVYSDEALLKVILENIIEAAVKFTDVGSIDIEVKHPDLELVAEKCLLPVENAKDNSFLMFKISDKSLGISNAELENLFEPYAQLDNPNKSSLFRSIAFATIKNIIRVLKGNVWVDSQPMQGTTYNVIIPAEKVIQSENE